MELIEADQTGNIDETTLPGTWVSFPLRGAVHTGMILEKCVEDENKAPWTDPQTGKK